MRIEFQNKCNVDVFPPIMSGSRFKIIQGKKIHLFPNKSTAYKEIYRTIKPNIY